MKKLDFLNKLVKEGRLELTEPSDEIKESYLEKAQDCLKSARLLHSNNLYENSISMSYYVMYNSLIALLSKAGLKSENHAASIILLDILFGDDKLYGAISFAKKERIDKQYYITSKNDFKLTKESSREMLEKAEGFLTEMDLLIKNVRDSEVNSYREKFKGIVDLDN